VLIWTNDPIVTTLTCLVKTTLAGWVSGIVFKAIKKKNETAAIFVASGIVPVINTAVFVVGCLLMTNSVHGMAGSANVFSVLWFILISIVTFNFFIEFAVNLLLAPALHTVYTVVEKRIRR
jgi:LytS/YehU family sensor histidine kinase